MSMVILFGGGDGGGILITAHGVRPIPPFDPAIRLALRSTAAMVNAAAAAKREAIGKKMAKEAGVLSNLAVELMEQVVGPLDAERAIVYQDEDGGFTCGSTGKPPIPIPWPPRSLPTAGELISAGIIEQDVIDLVQAAKAKNVKLTDIFENPAGAAKKLGVPLSERSAAALQTVAPGNLDRIKDDVDREVVNYFHKVAKDGRHLDTWFTRPYEVSRDLNIQLSDDALHRIVAGGGLVIKGNPASVDPYIAAGIAWGIVCIAIGTAFSTKGHAIDDIVGDRSGLDKI